jgi:hypothetical protein
LGILSVFDRQAKSPNHVSRNCEFDKDWLPGFDVAGSAGAALRMRVNIMAAAEPA